MTDGARRRSAARYALVFAGGVVGTALRAGLGLVAHPEPSASVTMFPITTLVINIVGAFLLGYLLESIVVSGIARRSSEAMRLAVGTGVLGGFTTYSALSVDTVSLASADLVAAVVYAGGSLVGGVMAAWAGIASGSRLSRRAPRNTGGSSALGRPS